METKKVNIVTGYSNPGGSTVALTRLTNLLNASGFDATLYGPHPWHLDKCNGKPITQLVPDHESYLISHYCMINRDVPFKKHILACHENGVFDLRQNLSKPEAIKDLSNWDQIVFVSESQQKWQGNPEGSIMIPNIVEGIEKQKIRFSPPHAAVIGSIDMHKQTAVSIQRAIDAGYEFIDIYGDLTDHTYFRTNVMPLMNKNIRYCGFVQDKQTMYEGLTEVFHSSLQETFNYVKMECGLAGVAYNGLDSADPKSEYWSKERIIEAWKNVLST